MVADGEGRSSRPDDIGQRDPCATNDRGQPQVFPSAVTTPSGELNRIESRMSGELSIGTMNTLQFQHRPLDQSRHQIRLIKVKYRAPSKFRSRGESITCRMEAFDLDQAPPYTALSYTWGSAANPRSILIDGCIHYVSRNLYSFLVLAGSTYKGRHFWIDQLSIDQQNIQERNHQVQRMGDIYQDAQVVIAWLGEYDKKVKEAFEHLRRRYKSPRTSSYVSNNAMKCLIQNVYWTRLWIVQELKLAKDVVFMAGKAAITKREFLGSLMGELNRYPGADRIMWLVSSQADREEFFERSARMEFARMNRTTALHTDAMANSVVPTSSVVFLPLQQVLIQFLDQECQDPRDKIFGLQLIVEPYERVPVDYARNMQDIYLLTTFSLLRHFRIPHHGILDAMHRKDKWPIFSAVEIFGDKVHWILLEIFVSLSDRARAKDTVDGLIWAKLLAGFSQVRKEFEIVDTFAKTFASKMEALAVGKEQRALSEKLVERFARYQSLPRQYGGRLRDEDEMHLLDLDEPDTTRCPTGKCRPGEACVGCYLGAETSTVLEDEATGPILPKDHLDQVVLELAAESGFVHVGRFLLHPSDPLFDFWQEAEKCYGRG